MQEKCQVCGSTEWLPLPNPVETQAVTTAGRIVNESLGKSQCVACGFVQRVQARFLGHTDYYEQDYAKYYDRPGTAQFHAARYRVLAEWMASILGPMKPERILDVGCGQGWAMEAMKSIYPEANIEGLEPSHFNSRVARDKGFVVYESRVGEGEKPRAGYDLVFSNNVIQHVTNAREFLASLKELVGEHGAIVITCPDGSVPNIEILWADQNFSFLPAHLARLCDEIGFEVISWYPSPPSPSVPPAQMLFLSCDATVRPDRSGVPVPNSSPEEVYKAKSEYLSSFKLIDDYLCASVQDRARVFNFGASYWSTILAAYCPRYWTMVSACVVDKADDVEPRFLDKEVIELSALQPEDDTIVFGTSPSTHNALIERFSPAWKHVVAWNQFAPQY